MKSNDSQDAEELVYILAKECNIKVPYYEIFSEGTEKYLKIDLSAHNRIFLDALSKATDKVSEDNVFKENSFLKSRKKKDVLSSPEVELLQKILSESLTIGRASLHSDFHKKFIPFVGGEETRIAGKTNSIVFGRRGAGKSSLILYGCRIILEKDIPFAWVAMQQYQGRDDLQIIPQILYQIIEQLEDFEIDQEKCEKIKELIYNLEDKGTDLDYKTVKIVIPRISRELLSFVKERNGLYIFIDDLHLIKNSIQPLLLSALYAISRGNDIYLKISAIESLTKLYDVETSEGLEIPGDIQAIKLDYNLLNPEKANKHIIDIINSYVQYVGIKSISQLCGVPTRNRLTWVSAGVPRDALYIFNNAITKAINEKRKTIAVMDINMAAADSMSEKERYLSDDVSDPSDKLRSMIEKIKKFCVSEANSNAFLVHTEKSNENYNIIRKLVDLRFLHILHPGITPDRANEKYEVLLLDYAFYTGFRRTPSIKEFKTVPETAKAKELRSLKRFNYNQE